MCGKRPYQLRQANRSCGTEHREERKVLRQNNPEPPHYVLESPQRRAFDRNAKPNHIHVSPNSRTTPISISSRLTSTYFKLSSRPTCPYRSNQAFVQEHTGAGYTYRLSEIVHLVRMTPSRVLEV